jgi:hypothetical protein
MRHRISKSVLAILVATTLGCGSDPTGSGDTPNTSLAFSPATVAMSDSQPTAKLFLTTEPSGGRLGWQVSAKPAWLTLDPDGGSVNGISPVTLTAVIPASQEPGYMQGALELVSSGGVARVIVNVSIAATPKLALAATSLAVAAGVDTQTMVLRNTGRGLLSWSAATSATWLKAIPAQGYIRTGDSATVKVVPDRVPLPAGTTSATITFTSGTSTLSLPVSVAVSAAPKALVRISRLAFAGSGSQSFYVVNRGKGALEWQAGTNDSWLTVSPTAGSVPPADSAKVTVTADAARAPAAPATGTVTVNSNAVDSPTLGLSAVLVASSPALGVRPLDYRVVDAEFSVAAGLLVTVSADPASLNVYDVETGESWSVALAKAPCCVSVRPDGRFAAVAHDAMVSYVDLATRQVVRTYPVTSDAIDVVLAMNGYAYVFPKTDQWVTMHGVNLTTGAESNGGSIYAGTRAKLHAGGEFMYGVWFLSPADIQKYDVRAGTPSQIGDSPYHGDYPIGYNLWLSQDGSRIFTEMGRVFRASSVSTEDMRYAGRLAGIEGARAIGDSPARGRVYAIGTASQIYYSGVPPEVRTAEVRAYDAGTLADLGATALPQIPSGAQSFDADGHYLFVNAAGTRVYVLLKAVPSSGLAKDWALLTLDAGTLP